MHVEMSDGASPSWQILYIYISFDFVEDRHKKNKSKKIDELDKKNDKWS